MENGLLAGWSKYKYANISPISIAHEYPWIMCMMWVPMGLCLLLNKIYSYSSWSRVNPPSGQWGCTCWVWYLLFPGAKFSFQIEHVKLHECNHTTSSSLSCQKWDEFSGFFFSPPNETIIWLIVCGHMPWLKKNVTYSTNCNHLLYPWDHVAPTWHTEAKKFRAMRPECRGSFTKYMNVLGFWRIGLMVYTTWKGSMAQLPCIVLSWPLTNPPVGGWAIYFHYGINHRTYTLLKKITLLRVIPTMTCWVEVVRWGLSLRIWWEEWRIWEHWFQVSLA